MKYILKYIIKSKYIGFRREYYKEFNSQFEIAHFIANNDIIEWTVYEKMIIEFSDLLVERNFENVGE